MCNRKLQNLRLSFEDRIQSSDALETQPLIAVRCSQRSAKYNPPPNLNGSSQNVSENDDD